MFPFYNSNLFDIYKPITITKFSLLIPTYYSKYILTLVIYNFNLTFTGGHKVGDTLSYHCPIGEMPIGEVNQTCGSNGKWSGQPISCKAVECGQVPGLANGEVHVLDGRTSWGARVLYKCKVRIG